MSVEKRLTAIQEAETARLRADVAALRAALKAVATAAMFDPHKDDLACLDAAGVLPDRYRERE